MRGQTALNGGGGGVIIEAVICLCLAMSRALNYRRFCVQVELIFCLQKNVCRTTVVFVEEMSVHNALTVLAARCCSRVTPEI